MSAENDDELRMAFAVDEISALLMETGYRKAVMHLTLYDKPSLRAALLDYHCVLKVKAAIDQYAEGLQQLMVLDLVQKFPSLAKPFFVSNGKKTTASEYMQRYEFAPEEASIVHSACFTCYNICR